jgi:NAD(P)-dependent dehydrogenase (short-subunit alcohol dehydrogenase family)
VGRSGGDLRADIANPDALRALFGTAAPYDAVVCAAGLAAFGELDSLNDDAFQLGLSSKLMGQVNLVRLGLSGITDGGSFTLTSGVLSQQPIPGSSAISMVNAGVEAFVRAAALEMPRGVRVNVVSPPWVRETLEAMGRDPSPGRLAAAVAKAYVDSVQGGMTGTVIDARAYA